MGATTPPAPANDGTKPSLGRPKNGKPFDADKRAKFLGLIEEGASVRQGAHLSGVSVKTVYNWLNSGRADGHHEHRKFAELFGAAVAKGTHELIKTMNLHAKDDFRAALSLLAARDERFGDRMIKRRKLKLENDRIAADGDLVKQQARLVAARASALERIAKMASGEGIPAFGLAVLLSDDGWDVKHREALARLCVERGYVAVERLDLGAEPDENGNMPVVKDPPNPIRREDIPGEIRPAPQREPSWGTPEGHT